MSIQLRSTKVASGRFGGSVKQDELGIQGEEKGTHRSQRV